MSIKILEIGCGQGFNSHLLAKSKNHKVVGIDLSKKEIQIAKKRYPQVDFRVMNAEKLDFKNASFDKVYAMDILEHVDKIEKVIYEVGRVLKKKGYFVVNVPYHKSEKWLLKIRPTYFKEIHHVRIFKENELDSICKKYGLVVKKKDKRGFLRHVELFFLFKRKIKSNTQVSIGSWRDNYFTKLVHVFVLYFEPLVLSTPLKYFPVWILTLPLGVVLNFFGNKVFPKSLYYEFEKK